MASPYRTLPYLHFASHNTALTSGRLAFAQQDSSLLRLNVALRYHHKTILHHTLPHHTTTTLLYALPTPYLTLHYQYRAAQNLTLPMLHISPHNQANTGQYRSPPHFACTSLYCTVTSLSFTCTLLDKTTPRYYSAFGSSITSNLRILNLPFEPDLHSPNPEY